MRTVWKLFSLLLFSLVLSVLSACAGAQKATGPARQGDIAEKATRSKAPVAPVPLEDYFAIHRVGGSSFSHDERLVAYVSDQGGRLDIWVQPVGGGEARQVTHVKGFVHSFAFSPSEDHLLFEADQGGNELPHIYLTDSQGKEPKDLMADYPEGARTEFRGWAEDGRSFAFTSNRRDPKYMDLYVYTLEINKAERLWEASGKLSVAKAGRDLERFIIGETISDVDSNLYLLHRGKKDLELLTPHKDEVLYWPTALSRDGKTLYYTSDEEGEFAALYEMDLETMKSKLVMKDDWDVEEGSFSDGWTYFYTVTNVDGTPRVVLKETKSGAEVPLPLLGGEGALVPFAFSRNDRYMSAPLVTATSPVAVYVVDMREKKATRLTDVLPDSLKDRKMVAGEVVSIPSFDEWRVPAFVYRPRGQGPFPAVIDVHGGPTWQSKRRFRPLRQYLVSKGYVVLVPNVRGSTGYGKSYTKLDNMDLGGGPLKDIVHCKKWLVANAAVDPDRVVVLGGSYGGYMALAAAAFTPGEFAAQVDYFGVSDLKTLVESFPPYWAAFATFIYKKFGDPNNPEHARYQHDRSPIHFVDQIKTPLLVVQGENDARVKKDQSDRIVEALKKRKVPVDYLVIPGEGHGFSKVENRLRAFQVSDRFLDRHIFGDESVKVLEQDNPAGDR